MAHTTRAYPSFRSIKQLEVSLLLLDGMPVHRRLPPRISSDFPLQFAGTHLYFWVERGTVRGKCLAQEHNTMTGPGLEPRPVDPKSSTLTIEHRVSHKLGWKIILTVFTSSKNGECNAALDKGTVSESFRQWEVFSHTSPVWETVNNLWVVKHSQHSSHLL